MPGRPSLKRTREHEESGFDEDEMGEIHSLSTIQIAAQNCIVSCQSVINASLENFSPRKRQRLEDMTALELLTYCNTSDEVSDSDCIESAINGALELTPCDASAHTSIVSSESTDPHGHPNDNDFETGSSSYSTKNNHKCPVIQFVSNNTLFSLPCYGHTTNIRQLWEMYRKEVNGNFPYKKFVDMIKSNEAFGRHYRFETSGVGKSKVDYHMLYSIIIDHGTRVLRNHWEPSMSVKYSPLDHMFVTKVWHRYNSLEKMCPITSDPFQTVMELGQYLITRMSIADEFKKAGDICGDLPSSLLLTSIYEAVSEKVYCHREFDNFFFPRGAVLYENQSGTLMWARACQHTDIQGNRWLCGQPAFSGNLCKKHRTWMLAGRNAQCI